MVDYHVVYVIVGPDESRRPATDRMQHECMAAGKEGWRLATAVPDHQDGVTRGVWLFFESGDDIADREEIRAAEAILEENAPHP